MPKVGMEPIRRQQLIDATLESVAEVGLQATTINSISKKAGLSSGIISHYFAGKQGLIEATVRYLLTNLKTSLLSKTEASSTPQQRLYSIVEANFSIVQKQTNATKTWLSFWAQSMHDPQMQRLQTVNSKRLYSNLLYSLKAFYPASKAKEVAQMTAAMIDGLWLRAVLSQADQADFKHAESLAKQYINSVISSGAS